MAPLSNWQGWGETLFLFLSLSESKEKLGERERPLTLTFPLKGRGQLNQRQLNSRAPFRSPRTRRTWKRVWVRVPLNFSGCRPPLAMLAATSPRTRKGNKTRRTSYAKIYARLRPDPLRDEILS